jgi:hypothetical protein
MVMRKSVILEIIMMALGLTGALNGFAQQPQTNAAVSAVNAEYTQGVGPGYWPTGGSGLTLNLTAGSIVCGTTPVTYAGGSLTMAASSTNYVQLNASSSCAPSSNTTGFIPGNSPIAVVTTNGSAIIGIVDWRPSGADGGLSNVAFKYASSDSVQYVSTKGNDSNDGLSPGTAKATIAGALSALPACTITHYLSDSGTYDNYTYHQCGQINVASGSYPIPSQISIASPFVRIQGSDPGSVVLNWTGTTGCAIAWTANPFTTEFMGSGGLYDVHIDGGNPNTAGTCGLNTYDISNFHMHGVVIGNFRGAGSIGWKDATVDYYNEKYDVEITLYNNTIGWEVSQSGANNTFGYGTFDVKVGTFNGQTGVLMTGAGLLTYSSIHLTINEVSYPTDNSTGLSVQGKFQAVANNFTVNIEDPYCSGCVEVNVGSGSAFQGWGVFNQERPGTNIIWGTFLPSFIWQISDQAAGHSFGLDNNFIQNTAKTSGWVYGAYSGAFYRGTTANTGDFFGVYSNAVQQGTGSMPWLQAVGGQTNASTSGVVTGAADFYAIAPNITGSGAITNAYGLYIEGQKISGVSGVTNGYGVYQTGAGDSNYFAGNVGIGTTRPQATLDTGGQDRRKPVTFSTLTACSSTIEGETAAVTDSTTNTWGATITGSGSHHVLAYCDGTHWTVGAL